MVKAADTPDFYLRWILLAEGRFGFARWMIDPGNRDRSCYDQSLLAGGFGGLATGDFVRNATTIRAA
jgi:hypothetical protein